MDVHRIVLLVVDHDGLGQQEVIDVLENARYPNHCIAPSVMQIDTAEVEWSDGHPLNHGDTTAEEFDRLFPRQGL